MKNAAIGGFIVAAFLVIEGLAAAAVIRVPDEYLTIQAAIDAANDGDVVIVAPGGYGENIGFEGKDVTVQSEDPDDPEVVAATVICGDGESSVVTFDSDETFDAVLAGFTIRYGGESGIMCFASSPTIVKNVVTDNEAYFGGGISCELGASPILDGNVITNNFAQIGGGVFCGEGSSLNATNNIIANNEAGMGGGGVGCDMLGNDITLINNTIANNRAAILGGGILFQDYGSLTITNSILWGNRANHGWQIEYCSSYPPIVNYCDIEGGWEGEENIDADPRFVEGPDGDYYLKHGNYFGAKPLQKKLPVPQVKDSPCVDAGDPESEMIVGTTWTNGLQDLGTVDLGYHYPIVLSPPNTATGGK